MFFVFRKWSVKGSNQKCNCSGRGKVRTNQGFFTIQQTCPQCNGYGETIKDPCKIAVVMEKRKEVKM